MKIKGELSSSNQSMVIEIALNSEENVAVKERFKKSGDVYVPRADYDAVHGLFRLILAPVVDDEEGGGTLTVDGEVVREVTRKRVDKPIPTSPLRGPAAGTPEGIQGASAAKIVSGWKGKL